MNIEFGCGETPTKPGYKTCDIRNLPGVNYVCPAWDIGKYVGKNTVDNIWSRHFFEHLTFVQGEKVLDIWFDILKPGGSMEMMLPNMEYHIKQWIERKTEKEFKHAQAGFWGWQRGDDWDTHKSGYDAQSLERLLKQKGFVRILNLKPVSSNHLHLRCEKNV
jgi:predicted SAM-dependent methyltransferase